MDGRIEPRFTVSSPIKVMLLSDLDNPIVSRMIDISAAGMRFVSGQPLPEDTVVAVDFDDHLAVTRVRNCLPYGDKFSIGTARIHSLPKDELPAGAPKWQHIRMLLEAKGWSAELGLADDQIQSPSSLGPDPGNVAATTEAESLVECNTLSEAPGSEPSSVTPALEAASSSSSTLIPVSVLREQKFHSPPTRQPEKAKRLALAAGGIALAMVAILLVHQSRPKPLAQPEKAPVMAAVNDRPAAATGGADAARKAGTGQEPGGKLAPATPEPSLKPAGAGSGHTVKLTVLEPGWVFATADGSTVFAKVLEKGTQDFRFTNFAYVHLGNSHNAEISLDGSIVPPEPGSGALRLVQLAASGARNIPWSNGDPAPPR